MSNITNLPSSQVSNILTTVNMATALQKRFFIAEMHSFMLNSQAEREYQSAKGQGSTVQVKIKPNHAEPSNITTFTQGTELSLSNYNRSSYGHIDVKLDYALADRFVFDSADLDFVEGNTTVNVNVERDHLESSMNVVLRKMKRTINDRLRTSTAGTNLGTSGTALNAEVFRKLRTAANKQGYQNEVIEVRLNVDVFEQATKIPEFATISGFVPVAGNTAEANTSISSTKFQVRGFYNMVLVSDDTYDRATPASDPLGTAYVSTSAVVPVRGLPVVDPANDIPMTFSGINMLYQKDTRKINVGRGVAGSLELLYGFKELSADINQSGVIQTTPIWQILGGVPVLAEPVAVGDAYTVVSGATLTVNAASGVLANDINPEIALPMTAVLVNNVDHGTLALASNGSFTYTSAAGFVGTDYFQYKARTAAGDSQVATATIVVTAT